MWRFDPDLLHLNHGSFGACPAPVLAAQQRWRDTLERDATGFFDLQYDAAVAEARQVLAAFLGADPAGLVFITNSTTGVNAVLRSIGPTLRAGDEILVTDHTYNACRNAVDAVAGVSGARVVVAHVPFPITAAAEATEAVLAKAGAHTRLALIDHVTSSTALVLPVADIVAALEPDVPVLIDGAHAPGMVPLHLDALGASYSVGNCHKWMCAPKGAAYLHVRADRRPMVDPLVISHGWNAGARSTGNRLHDLFDWPGTHDPSAWLSVPTAIGTVATLHADGWPGVMRANCDLALAARRLVCYALGVEPPCPEEMIGSMAALQVGGTGSAEHLRAWLRAQHGIVVPVSPWPSAAHRLVRWSAHRYNDLHDYARLADALVEWCHDHAPAAGEGAAAT
jgi:isopenicillin-N epimerase